MPQDKPKPKKPEKDGSYMWIEPGWVEPGDKVAKPKAPPVERRRKGPPERMPLVPNYGRRRNRLLRA